MRKRIIFIMPYFIKDNTGGGAEVQAYIKAKHIAAKGDFEVMYLTSNPGNRPEEEIVEGIKVLRKLRMPFPLRNTLRIFREILRLRPCAVYTRMNWPALLPAGLASKITGSRSLWFATEARGLQPFYNTKNFFRSARKYRGTALIKLPPLLINAVLEDLFFHQGIYLMDRHFAQNREQREILSSIYRIDASIFPSVHEIPWKKPDKEPEPTIIWVANFSFNKRPELFMELARRLPDYRFIMAGNIRAGYEFILQRGPKNLTALGRIPFHRSEELFERAWVYVNTSLSEGFPNTFLQAWKYRTAVVSMNVDPDGLLSRRALGILTENSIEKTIEAVRELVENPSMRESMTSRAYEYVKTHHDVKNIDRIIGDLECP